MQGQADGPTSLRYEDEGFVIFHLLFSIYYRGQRVRGVDSTDIKE
jgi:hypothetical protein